MDFFAQQDCARKKTFHLALLLVAAVFGVILATDLVVTVASYFVLDVPIRWTFFHPLLDEVLLVAIIVFAVRRLYQLRDGGDSIARMVKARQVLRNSVGFEEKRLLNIVDEMAIAAGITVPSVWVMDTEEGINAFAAGYSPNQAVIVVTGGALKKLNREELQGVIGHEFGHILNGDMRLNVRLIGILAGIVVVGEAGLLIMRLGAEADEGALAIIPTGALIAALGYIGVFIGRMIKAAVSRQREFLADASSVQFTRNPDGLVSALRKIHGGDATLVKNAYAGEMSHMFFAQAFTAKAFADLLATHPTIEERVASMTGGKPALTGSADGTPAKPASDSEMLEAAISGGFGGAIASTMLSQIGTATPQHVELACEQLAAMPDSFRQALNTPDGARCAVYAYLISPDASVRTIQLRALEQAGDSAMAGSLDSTIGILCDLGPAARLTVLSLALPALRQMDQSARSLFLGAVDQLVMADDKVTLDEFVIRTILQRQLSAQASRAERVRFQTVASVKSEVVVLLATIARAGSPEPKAQALAFDRGIARLNFAVAIPPDAGFDTKAVGAALNRLRQLSPLAKPSVLLACVDTALADGKLLVAEMELLRAIGMSIDCPMPPTLASQPVV